MRDTQGKDSIKARIMRDILAIAHHMETNPEVEVYLNSFKTYYA